MAALAQGLKPRMVLCDWSNLKPNMEDLQRPNKYLKKDLSFWGRSLSFFLNGLFHGVVPLIQYLIFFVNIKSNVSVKFLLWKDRFIIFNNLLIFKSFFSRYDFWKLFSKIKCIPYLKHKMMIGILVEQLFCLFSNWA